MPNAWTLGRFPSFGSVNDESVRVPEASSRSLRGLDGLNLFLADVRDGLGPYLAIYLVAVRGPSLGWNEATAGMVMTIAGIVGLLVQTPAGAFVDRAKDKRLVIAIAAIAITISCLLLPLVHGFWAVTATQAVAAIGGAVVGPAVASLALGLVGSGALARRIGRNEAFNHSGNALSAAAAGALAWKFGPIVVFWLMAGLAVLSVIAVLRIRAADIDNKAARGCPEGEEDGAAVSIWQLLSGNRPLLIFAALAFLFHLANAAMLTSVSQLLARSMGKDAATSLTAACIVAAQLMMVPVAMIVGRKADDWGRKPIMIAGFAVLALRGFLYTLSQDAWWLVAVQALDGIGAGIFGALFPVIVADLTKGSGRFNVAQGAVATFQGAGAAISAALAGWIIVGVGYSAAFLSLAAIAGVGLVGYLLAMPETGDGKSNGRGEPAPAPAE